MIPAEPASLRLAFVLAKRVDRSEARGGPGHKDEWVMADGVREAFWA